MDFVYSFISSKTVILAEYIQSPGAYIKNSFASLRKLYTNATREFTFKLDGYVYAYSFKDGFTYCVVAVDSVRKHVTMAYLGRVMEEFANRYGKGDEVTVAAYSLSEEFMPILKEQMQYLVDHPEENDIGNEANAIYIANVTNVGDKGEMRKNFGKVPLQNHDLEPPKENTDEESRTHENGQKEEGEIVSSEELTDPSSEEDTNGDKENLVSTEDDEATVSDTQIFTQRNMGFESLSDQNQKEQERKRNKNKKTRMPIREESRPKKNGAKGETKKVA